MFYLPHNNITLVCNIKLLLNENSVLVKMCLVNSLENIGLRFVIASAAKQSQMQRWFFAYNARDCHGPSGLAMTDYGGFLQSVSC
jgi:hypothetical protein